MIVRQLLPRVSRLSRGTRGSHVVPSWQSEAERTIRASLSGENWQLYTEVGGKVQAAEQRLAAKLDALEPKIAGMETKMNGKIDRVEQRVNKLVEDKVTQAERMLRKELAFAMVAHTGFMLTGFVTTLAALDRLGFKFVVVVQELPGKKLVPPPQPAQTHM